MDKKVAIFLSLIVLGLGTFLIVKDFHKEQIKIWDEASSAKNAIDMLANRNFLIQYNDGVPVRDDFKPPLSLWLKMLTYQLFGINEFSVRLPSIIAAILTMLVLWYYGFFVLKRPDFGILAALLLVTSRGYVFYHVARTGDPDSLLVFFSVLAALTLFHLINTYPVKRNRNYLLLGISLTLAMYTKGIMGLAPMAGIGLYLLLSKRGRPILIDYRLYLTGLVTLFLIIIYYVVRETIDQGYIEGVLKYEIVSFTEAPVFVKHPEFGFYFNYLLEMGFRPFLYLAPLSILVWFISTDRLIKELILFSFFGSTIFLLAMSGASLKNEWYISPSYPYLAIFIAAGLVGLRAIILHKLPSGGQLYINLIFLLVISLLAFKPVKEIHKANHKYKDYVYPPEREGRFFESVKNLYPDQKEIGVITPYHIRQVQFYAKKFDFIDSTITTIYRKIPQNILNSRVIICDPLMFGELSKQYVYEILQRDEYCYFIEIKEYKDPADSLVIYCCLEIYSSDSLFFLDSLNPEIKFYNPGISKDHSFSGNYSVLSGPGRPFALTTNFSLPESYGFISAEVWARPAIDKIFLVISIPDLGFYIQTGKTAEKKLDWEKIILKTPLPPNYRGENIKVYIWNNSEKDVTFDDLKIVVY